MPRPRRAQKAPKRSAPLPRIHDHSVPPPPEPPGPPLPQTTTDPPTPEIARINALSLVARTTWFGLLAYLAFVGVTLLGVEDADFFVPSRQTQLPLVNVSIPTSAFFWFAPLLGAALYAYLHLQLVKLWEALAPPVPPKTNGKYLSELVYPWLISDFALSRRTDDALKPRPLAILSRIVTWWLVWASAPLILAGFWWRSMPKHDEGMTLWIAAAMMLAAYVGLTSNWRATILLRRNGAPSTRTSPWQGWTRRIAFATLCLLIVATSWLRTEGGIDHYVYRGVTLINDVFRTEYFRECGPDFEETSIFPRDYCQEDKNSYVPRDLIMARRIAAHPWVATLDELTFGEDTPLIGGWIDSTSGTDTWTTLTPTNLTGVNLVPNPDNLLDHTTERRRFRKVWCQRQGIDLEACGRLYTAAEPAPEHLERRRLDWCKKPQRTILTANCQPFFKTLDDEFRTEWDQLWTSRTTALGSLDLSGTDLRNASMGDSFLIGVDLSGARMEGADLIEARMEGAILRNARMEGAILSGARMEGADLSFARMEGADLIRARMEGANLIEVRMEGARLHSADLKSAALTDTFADTSVR
ncbi:MAG: pentapeptide repeat-containing protein, partial [Pseudomonadota bacterium]